MPTLYFSYGGEITSIPATDPRFKTHLTYFVANSSRNIKTSALDSTNSINIPTFNKGEIQFKLYEPTKEFPYPYNRFVLENASTHFKHLNLAGQGDRGSNIFLNGKPVYLINKMIKMNLQEISVPINMNTKTAILSKPQQTPVIKDSTGLPPVVTNNSSMELTLENVKILQKAAEENAKNNPNLKLITLKPEQLLSILKIQNRALTIDVWYKCK